MILDEHLEMVVKRPFKVSSGGDFFQAKTLDLLPPTPRMARETFKMVRYFNSMNKEVATFAMGVAGEAAIQDAAAQKIEAGSPVASLHEEYKDDDPAAREAKLQEIEKNIEFTTQMLSMCDGIDLYKMTTDFGKMVIGNNRCFIKCSEDGGEEKTEVMTFSLWENDVDYKERLAITIRYCCFFGLTSSTID
jgi:hypothetical protein